jgi:aerotaxis receptor
MSDERVRYSNSDSLISTTTAESHITYCNDDFSRVSGYKEDELLGKPHNVIRHNDMPKLAFGQLWQYIRSGKSWMGLVKNRCKGQGHYWVSAFVTPILDKDGKVFEYQSVRTQPTDEQISRAKTLYARMQNGAVAVKRINWSLLASLLVIVQLLFITLAALGILSSMVSLGGLAVAAFAQLLIMFKLKQRLSTVNDLASSHYDNPLMEMPYTGHCDDVSRIELTMMMKGAELRAVTARAAETSANLLLSAEEELANSQAIDAELNEQNVATDAMAVSAEEMLASIDEVAQHAKQSSEFANNAQLMASKGVETIEEAVETVDILSGRLQDSQQALVQLYSDVGSIEAILGMIQGIAEQTNLLALNAAIEAARAGEAGRGFAVVADEVRALSLKTRTSVDDIREKIEVLQSTVNKTGSLMEAGQKASEISVTKSQQSRDAFRAIVDDLASMGEQSATTSQAIMEQVQVTQGMVEHVHRMKNAIHATQTLSGSSVGRTGELVVSLESLQRLVAQFSRQ